VLRSEDVAEEDDGGSAVEVEVAGVAFEGGTNSLGGDETSPVLLRSKLNMQGEAERGESCRCEAVVCSRVTFERQHVTPTDIAF
jgi:hypothetical protein